MEDPMDARNGVYALESSVGNSISVKGKLVHQTGTLRQDTSLDEKTTIHCTMNFPYWEKHTQGQGDSTKALTTLNSTSEASKRSNDPNSWTLSITVTPNAAFHKERRRRMTKE